MGRTDSDTWIARPSLLLTSVLLLVVVFIAVLAVTPVVREDSGPSFAVARDFWWARIAPGSFAPHALRHAEGLYLSDLRDQCPDLEGAEQAWITILRGSGPGDQFFQIFASASAAGRVYALVGLTATASPRLQEALAQTAADTAHVLILADTVRRMVSMVQVANPDSLQRWAQVLRAMGRGKCEQSGT